MTEDIYSARLNGEGRIVIPAALRKELGLEAGQEILLRQTGEGLLLYTQEQAVKRLQDWVGRLVEPGRSLADELIAERRTEAAREEEEDRG